MTTKTYPKNFEGKNLEMYWVGKHTKPFRSFLKIISNFVYVSWKFKNFLRNISATRPELRIGILIFKLKTFNIFSNFIQIIRVTSCKIFKISLNIVPVSLLFPSKCIKIHRQVPLGRSWKARYSHFLKLKSKYLIFRFSWILVEKNSELMGLFPNSMDI